eukprot:m.53090 g.53090  ORF g.53090 m.53090 type:complete len:634 (+) comp7424_c0_seq2:107-2008(+)
MGNGFNDADRLGNRGWKGGAVAVLEKLPGTTNAQKAAAEALRVRNDVGVPRDIVAARPGDDGFKVPSAKPRRKQKVLDEDVYTSAIEKIVRRDFFPELSVLEAQAAYLTALEADDNQALRELSARFATPTPRHSRSAGGSAPPSAPATPAGWETPSVAGTPRAHAAAHAVEDDGAATDGGRRGKGRAVYSDGHTGGQERVGGGQAAAATSAQRDDPVPSPRADWEESGGRLSATKHNHTAAVAAAVAVGGAHAAAHAVGVGGKTKEEELGSVDVPLTEADTSMSLDAFLATYTSEDNESFEMLMEKHREKLIRKHEWLYRKAHEQRKQLALTSDNTDRKAKELEHGMEMPIEGWHYTPKNSLMYQPKDRDMAIATKIDTARAKPQSVNHANTRFAAPPFPTTGHSTASSLSRGGGGSRGSRSRSGKDGHGAGDDPDSPKVNGYGFVVTPSPQPGVDLDPTMTWGVVDGTPFRLDASDTADDITKPIFTLPAQTPREKASIRMQEDAARRKRKRTADAEASATAARQTPRTHARTMTPHARLATLSPAAQRLGRQLLKGRGGALAQAYSGRGGGSSSTSSLRTPGSARFSATPTPLHRSTLTTPRARAGTTSTSGQADGKAAAAAGGSITDGLL